MSLKALTDALKAAEAAARKQMGHRQEEPSFEIVFDEFKSFLFFEKESTKER